MTFICPVCCETMEADAQEPLDQVVCPRCRSTFDGSQATVVQSGGGQPAGVSWDLTQTSGQPSEAGYPPGKAAANSGSDPAALPAALPVARSAARPAALSPALSAALPATLPEIPGYDVLAFVARGAMGILLKARHQVLDRVVAIKLPLHRQGMTAAERDRFLREARAAAKLRHPNICPIYEVAEQQEGPYIAMGFIEGATLRDWAKAVHPRPRQAADMVAKLARAVGYAHHQGIIHRDIKPSNVMVEADTGEPVLTDFGLAKEMSEHSIQLTRAGQVVGTPAYMAPEQAAGRLNLIGPRTDVYALATVLYELVCDRPPFLGSFGDVIRRVQTDPPISPRRLAPHIHRDLETICLKGLAKSPALRYESAIALAEDLERFSAGEPILARREPLVAKVVRRVRHHPVAVPAFLVTLLVAALVISGLAIRSSRQGKTARLTASFEAALKDKNWTAARLEQVEGLAGQLELLAPDIKPQAGAKLRQAFAAAVRESIRRPAFQPQDLSDIKENIRLLASRDADLASAVEKELGERLRLWEVVFDINGASPRAATGGQPSLEALFEPKASVSPGPDWGTLVVKGPTEGAAASSLALTQTPCRGNVQLEATFPADWGESREFGLTLNASKNWCYTFVIASVAPPAPGEGDSPPSKLRLAPPAMKHAATLSLRIQRNKVVLLEKIVRQAEIKPGPLRLVATRMGDRLTFQANDLLPLVHLDAFPLTALEPGVYGLYGPEAVRITHLRAMRQPLPVTPSPLEQGDELYSQDRFSEALGCYQRQALALMDQEFKQEVAYKQAMCLERLKRQTEAIAALDALAALDGPRWPMLARCELWKLYVRDNEHQAEADALFASLSRSYHFEELALLIPRDVLDSVLNTYSDKASGVSIWDYAPNRVRNLERAVAVEDYFRSVSPEANMRKCYLFRAYCLDRQTGPALQTAERLLASAPLPEAATVWWWYALWEERCWMMCRAQQADKALALLDKLLIDHKGDYREEMLPLLPARARVHAALGQWDKAEQDVEEFFRRVKPGDVDYRFYGGASLIRGLLRERRGDRDGALAAWRGGLPKVHPTYQWLSTPSMVQLAYSLILASLTDELAEQEVEAVINKGVSRLTGSGWGIALVQTLLPDLSPKNVKAILHNVCNGPDGRKLIFDLALLQTDLPDLLHAGVVHVAFHTARQIGLEGHASAQQEQVLRDLAKEGCSAYAAGKIGKRQALQLGLTWTGSTNFLGWAGVYPTLQPALRGPMAYVMGLRYLRLGRAKDAATFFSTAAADAARGSVLDELARAELARLKESAAPIATQRDAGGKN